MMGLRCKLGFHYYNTPALAKPIRWARIKHRGLFEYAVPEHKVICSDCGKKRRPGKRREVE